MFYQQWLKQRADVKVPDPTLSVYGIHVLEHQIHHGHADWQPVDATFKLGSARDEKNTFSSDKYTISNRQGGLGFWLEFLLLISQEGEVTISVTISGGNSAVHHTVYQITSSYQTALEPVRMGFWVCSQ